MLIKDLNNKLQCNETCNETYFKRNVIYFKFWASLCKRWTQIVQQQTLHNDKLQHMNEARHGNKHVSDKHYR